MRSVAHRGADSVVIVCILTADPCDEAGACGVDALCEWSVSVSSAGASAASSAADDEPVVTIVCSCPPHFFGDPTVRCSNRLSSAMK